MSRIYLGRHIYGFAVVLSGVIALTWRDLHSWQQSMPIGKVPYPQIFLYFAGAIQLLGGIAIQWPQTRRIGALALASISLIFVLLWVPEIVAAPLIFNNWGAPWYDVSLASAALIAYGMSQNHATSPNHPEGAQKLARLGYVLFGISVLFFLLEQIAYFSVTLRLVPKWIPPGQMFWAVATTIAFGLAAVALLSGRFALLAARLLTLMLIGFGLLIWIPAVISNPHRLFNWTEHNQNLAIAGAAWIVADFLTQNRSGG